jgi:hypothetical protein
MKTTPETGTEGIANGKDTVDGAARRLDMNIPVEAVMEDSLETTNTKSDGNQGVAILHRHLPLTWILEIGLS